VRRPTLRRRKAPTTAPSAACRCRLHSRLSEGRHTRPCRLASVSPRTEPARSHPSPGCLRSVRCRDGDRLIRMTPIGAKLMLQFNQLVRPQTRMDACIVTKLLQTFQTLFAAKRRPPMQTTQRCQHIDIVPMLAAIDRLFHQPHALLRQHGTGQLAELLA